jgi:hypothetical protein
MPEPLIASVFQQLSPQVFASVQDTLPSFPRPRFAGLDLSPVEIGRVGSASFCSPTWCRRAEPVGGPAARRPAPPARSRRWWEERCGSFRDQGSPSPWTTPSTSTVTRSS